MPLSSCPRPVRGAANLRGRGLRSDLRQASLLIQGRPRGGVHPVRPPTDRHTVAARVGAVCPHPVTLACSPGRSTGRYSFSRNSTPPHTRRPSFTKQPRCSRPLGGPQDTGVPSLVGNGPQKQNQWAGMPVKGSGAMGTWRGGGVGGAAVLGGAPTAPLRQAACSGPSWGHDALFVWRRGESAEV